MVIVTDKDQKVLTVDNPDALKGHEGHHIAVTGHCEWGFDSCGKREDALSGFGCDSGRLRPPFCYWLRQSADLCGLTLPSQQISALR